MRKWLGQLDRILRGDATQLPALREGRIDISGRGLSTVLLILAMIYGLCMGCFAMTRGTTDAWKQVFASTFKFPALFFLTLIVTFPSLYVFNALVGSRLTPISLGRLLTAAVGVMLAVLASFGTIVAFFSFTTTSYPFMVLLNVIACSVGGALGLKFLLQTLHRLTMAMIPPAPSPQPSTPPPLPTTDTLPEAKLISTPPKPGALDMPEGHVLGSNVKLIFRIWIIVFALVGSQMSWVLRPFIGNPAQPFSLFRPKGSNFFEAVFGVIRNLLGA